MPNRGCAAVLLLFPQPPEYPLSSPEPQTASCVGSPCPGTAPSKTVFAAYPNPAVAFAGSPRALSPSAQQGCIGLAYPLDCVPDAGHRQLGQGSLEAVEHRLAARHQFHHALRGGVEGERWPRRSKCSPPLQNLVGAAESAPCNLHFILLSQRNVCLFQRRQTWPFFNRGGT